MGGTGSGWSASGSPPHSDAASASSRAMVAIIATIGRVVVTLLLPGRPAEGDGGVQHVAGTVGAPDEAAAADEDKRGTDCRLGVTPVTGAVAAGDVIDGDAVAVEQGAPIEHRVILAAAAGAPAACT